MAKKKEDVTEEIQPEGVAVVEVIEKPAPAPVLVTSGEAVENRVKQISSLFPLVGDIEGETFDPSNPDHILIAAFLVGKLGYLRRL